MREEEQVAPKRILILGMTENQGGLESYIYNIYTHLDLTKVQFDFIKVKDGKLAYEDEYIKMGSRIFRIPLKSEGIKLHKKALDDLYRNNHYEAIYYQCNHKLVSLDFFKYAKKYGVKKRIAHSHNTHEPHHSVIHEIREKLVERQFDSYVNYCFACSNDAGAWMFGSRKYKVIRSEERRVGKEC